MAKSKRADRLDVSIRRYKWLSSNGLDLRRFAEQTKNDFGTAYKWFEFGRTPRRKYLEPVLVVFPDWPLPNKVARRANR